MIDHLVDLGVTCFTTDDKVAGSITGTSPILNID